MWEVSVTSAWGALFFRAVCSRGRTLTFECISSVVVDKSRALRAVRPTVLPRLARLDGAHLENRFGKNSQGQMIGWGQGVFTGIPVNAIAIYTPWLDRPMPAQDKNSLKHSNNRMIYAETELRKKPRPILKLSCFEERHLVC